jgi:hypothetical protein
MPFDATPKKFCESKIKKIDLIFWGEKKSGFSQKAIKNSRRMKTFVLLFFILDLFHAKFIG